MSGRHQIEWIHQILIADDMQIPKVIPDSIQKNIDFAKEVYPHPHHKMWGGEELRELIREEFGMEVMIAFEKITNHSYKINLSKFSHLWFYGGIYCDLDISLLHSWDIPQRCVVAAFSEMYPDIHSLTISPPSLLSSIFLR